MDPRAPLSVLVLSLTAHVLPAARGSEPAESVRIADEGRNFLLLPVPFYTHDTGFAGSLIGICWERGEHVRKRSSFTAFYTHTENEQKVFQVLPDLYMSSGRLNVKGLFAYEDWPSLYYGIGPDTLESDVEKYVAKGTRGSLVLNRKIVGGLWLGGRFEYEDMEVTPRPGGLLDTGGLTGSTGCVASGLGLQLVLDTRDDVLRPTDGWHVRVSSTIFDEAFGSEFDFSVNSLDAKRYFPVRTGDVLALELVGRSADGEVPFQQLSPLGGQSIMRGYYWGRFRDDTYAAFQTEYRMHLTRRLGVAAFAGFGGVADTVDQLDLDSFQLAGGVGVRFRLGDDARVTARADVAFTEEGTAVYLMLDEAF
ncbi:MAG: BamA/TamA family outer membrane protein [Planctomycetota bacterium]|jgi:hypothetical protein